MLNLLHSMCQQGPIQNVDNRHKSIHPHTNCCFLKIYILNIISDISIDQRHMTVKSSDDVLKDQPALLTGHNVVMMSVNSAPSKRAVGVTDCRFRPCRMLNVEQIMCCFMILILLKTCCQSLKGSAFGLSTCVFSSIFYCLPLLAKPVDQSQITRFP